MDTIRNHKVAPLRRYVTIEDVDNTAVYLCSDLFGGVTGEVIHMDAGFHIIGVARPDEDEES